MAPSRLDSCSEFFLVLLVASRGGMMGGLSRHAACCCGRRTRPNRDGDYPLHGQGVPGAVQGELYIEIEQPP